MKYVTMPSGIAIAWLPNALLLALFITRDIKEWKYFIPFFILAEIIADCSVFTIIQALQFSFINLFETMTSAYLIKRFSGQEKTNFTSTKYVIVFYFVALHFMPAVSAFLGASVYFTQIGSDSSYFELWRIWFFGDSLGILLLTPIIILVKENYKSLKYYKCEKKDLLVIIISIFLAIELFSFNEISSILPTPLILILIPLWIVYKQGILPGLIFALIIAIIAIFYTSNGVGPFSIFGTKETTIYIQEFINLLLVVTLFFGVLHKEILESKKNLEELNNTLEEKVIEKTKSLVLANEKLIDFASKDPLTHIYNRRMIDEYISKEVMQAQRYNHDLSLIMIDIDYFKRINDNYGHQIGDKVLIETVNIMTSSIREVDILGRWGGEEFIIILPQTQIEQAYKLAERIRKKVEDTLLHEVGKQTICLGVTAFKTNDNPNLLIKRADDALYIAKNTGRNRTEIK